MCNNRRKASYHFYCEILFYSVVVLKANATVCRYERMKLSSSYIPIFVFSSLVSVPQISFSSLKTEKFRVTVH